VADDRWIAALVVACCLLLAAVILFTTGEQTDARGVAAMACVFTGLCALAACLRLRSR